MTTTIKKNTTHEPATNSNTLIADVLKKAVADKLKTDNIEFSPLNYRKYFSEQNLNEFAKELAQHGIISPLLVRPLKGKIFELVAGERRLRAARIAGMSTVPVAIADLTDEQVREIQLSENIQREDPHPMHEAQGIGGMQADGLKLDEIATRLGKSRQYIYVRLKLLNLIEGFQEMFVNNRMNMTDALQIARLSHPSQNDFYADRCSEWKKHKNFELYNVEYALRNYRYDLRNAPFDKRDKNLVPHAGACSGCAFNSATLKSLFPDEAKQAICSKIECYRSKCTAHLLATLTNSIETYLPVAILYDNQLPETAAAILPMVEAAASLQQLNAREITLIEEPKKPLKDSYKFYGEKGKRALDEEAYEEAVQNYETLKENYKLHKQTGHYQLGILVDDDECRPVYFSMEKPRIAKGFGEKVTAKQVQEAVKAGIATPDLLQGEIDRIKEREARSQEIDRDKVQLTVHKMLADHAAEPANNTALTAADQAAARWLIYQSIDYSGKHAVDAVIFPGDKFYSHEKKYTIITELTDQQFSYLIRIALCNKSDSKYPNNTTGYFLYKVAQNAGLPVAAVEQEQTDVAATRKQKQDGKIKDLKKQIGQLKKKKAA